MEVTVLQRDVLQQAINDLRVRYAGYHVVSISESWTEIDRQSLIKQGVWHGYYERLSVRWEFALTKLSGDYKGPDRLSVGVSPVFDIVFADIYPNVFVIEVGFNTHPDRSQRPLLHGIDGIEGNVWDLYYFYDARLRDL